jgi:hypothetical protein
VVEGEGKIWVDHNSAEVAGGGTDSSGALALLLCFFLVVNTSKMLCKNSSSSLSGVTGSLTCRMCDLITSSI